MSSNHMQQLKKSPSYTGEIRHLNALSEHYGAMCFNNKLSDVILQIENEEFHAHKIVLVCRSEYFNALLTSGMRESSQSKIVIKDSSVDAFKILMKYIYSGVLNLQNLNVELVLEILGLAHKYGFIDLENAISDYLRQSLTIQNCCLIYDCANLYSLKFLMRVAACYIDEHVSGVIVHDAFLQLSTDSIKSLISRDSFFAPEIDIFEAVCRWIQANNDITLEGQVDVLSNVRLPLLSVKDLLTVVRPKELISSDTILDAVEVQSIHNNSGVKHRGLLKPELNMASTELGSMVTHGEMKPYLLDGDTSNYDMEIGYTRHSIGTPDDPGIVVKLGSQCIVNHIKLLLWDKDIRSYSYYIEVSVDQKDWIRVIDYTQYHCRSWQYLYFEPKVVRYIRIMGTSNTVNKVFHAVSFEIMYTTKPFVIQKGIIVPQHNVASMSLSANVIEGVSRTRQSLIDGNTELFDWESGYTCHQLGSGCILIQLGQPYLIDSMRMRLWDRDDRLYSYYIDVSVNMWDWEMVADKTTEQCKSWQVLYFKRRPVVFIRITGTQNTANEVFHLVHFECPAQFDEAAASTEKTSNSTDLGFDAYQSNISTDVTQLLSLSPDEISKLSVK